MTNALTDHMIYPPNSDKLVGKLADLKIAFWDEGIDTQKVLPNGTESEISDHVRSNLDALAPGGGYVY